MTKKLFLFIFYLTLSITPSCKGDAKEDAMTSKGQLSIQQPVVAGAFYPSDREELKNMVDRFLKATPKKKFDGPVIGVIAPHAGYIYSGVVAGSAFKQVEGERFERVVVMAPSHRVRIAGAALSNKDVYRTPLGDVPIDTEAVKKLAGGNAWGSLDDGPFSVEHSLEVELPFLQETLRTFKLVPMIIGAHDKKTLDEITAALNAAFDSGDTLFVASSDLSHYTPYDTAKKMDAQTLDIVAKKGTEEYLRAVGEEKVNLCGSAPVYIMKKLAELKGAHIEVVDYKNSGDTSGDKSGVVGYGALAVIGGKAVAKKNEESWLTDAQKKTLLEFARGTVEAHVRGKKLPPLPNDPALKKDGAAFVTLREKGELRGCIGHIIAMEPLDRTIQGMAVAASSEDPRFHPVRPEELKGITIEISVLTPPTELKNPMDVRVGMDGLIIRKGYSQGVLLPQVPTEQGWDKLQYLEGICRKAGLPKDAWRDASLQRFQAIVFGEEE